MDEMTAVFALIGIVAVVSSVTGALAYFFSRLGK